MTLSLSRIFFFFYIEKIIAQNFKIYLPVEIKRIIKYLHEMKGEALEKSMQKKKTCFTRVVCAIIIEKYARKRKKRRQNWFRIFFTTGLPPLKERKKKKRGVACMEYYNGIIMKSRNELDGHLSNIYYDRSWSYGCGRKKNRVSRNIPEIERNTRINQCDTHTYT